MPSGPFPCLHWVANRKGLGFSAYVGFSKSTLTVLCPYEPQIPTNYLSPMGVNRQVLQYQNNVCSLASHVHWTLLSELSDLRDRLSIARESCSLPRPEQHRSGLRRRRLEADQMRRRNEHLASQLGVPTRAVPDTVVRLTDRVVRLEDLFQRQFNAGHIPAPMMSEQVHLLNAELYRDLRT
jgi:hypothetical protein